MLVDFSGNVLLCTIHLHGRHKLAVGEMRYSFVRSAYPCESFYMIIPGGNIFISDRPIYRNSVFRIGLKIKVTPAVALTSPHQGPSTHMISPYPVKRRILHKGTFFFFHPEIQALLYKIGTTPCRARVSPYV